MAQNTGKGRRLNLKLDERTSEELTYLTERYGENATVIIRRAIRFIASNDRKADQMALQQFEAQRQRTAREE